MYSFKILNRAKENKRRQIGFIIIRTNDTLKIKVESTSSLLRTKTEYTPNIHEDVKNNNR